MLKPKSGFAFPLFSVKYSFPHSAFPFLFLILTAEELTVWDGWRSVVGVLEFLGKQPVLLDTKPHLKPGLFLFVFFV